MFRYWTGTSWSSALTADPRQAPPAAGIGQPPTPQPFTGQASTGGPGPGWQPTKKSRVAAGWWLGGGALVLALVVALWYAFGWIGGLINGTTTEPGSNPTASVCPKRTVELTPVAHPNDGRVHGGMLSYPQLGEPWGAPESEDRVPFGSDVLTQIVVVEENYSFTNSWVASVLVGELIAGDGFFTPQEGSEIVVKCLMGVFYADANVGRADKVNKATKVDGKDAWLVETHLTFDIPDLKTKGETAIVLIVATGESSSSIFYASIPDTSPQLLPDARRAMAELKVGA